MAAQDGGAFPLHLVGAPDRGDDPGTSLGVTPALVDRVRLALAAVLADPPPAGLVEEADGLCAALDALARGSGADHDARKLELWSAVATARADLKAAELRRGRPEAPALSTGAVTAVERAWAAVEEAQARAERKLASPGAFRRLVEAKRDAQKVLDGFGFASIDEYRDAVEGKAAAATESPELLAEARRAVRDAEQAWDRFLAEPEWSLPATTEADALRARAYRVLGRVVDDEELVLALHVRTADARADQAARSLLRSTLAQVGEDPGTDPVAAAERWLGTVSGDGAGPARS